MPQLRREPGRLRAGERRAAVRRLSLLAAELERPPPDDGTEHPPPRDEAASVADPTVEVEGDPAGRHRAAALPARQRLTGALADQLPPTLRTAGTDRGVTGQHVTVLVLVTALLLAAGAWWLLDGRPSTRVVGPEPPVPVTADAPSADPGVGVTPAVPGAAPAGVPPTPTATVGTDLVVDVTGRVRRPGLVTLPYGARVADALESAGGPRPRVDLSTLNLARLLVDGEQIVVGMRVATLPPAAATASGVPVAPVPGVPAALVDLNTADLALLDTLPGVGPVTAQAILDWRSANGRFTSVDELLAVDGIGDVTLADLRDLVTV